MSKKILFLLLLLIVVPGVLQARLGVGIGTGKIVVEEKLRPGQIYELPPITILNTGDEKATYAVRTAYHEKQPEIAPPIEWFIFNPKEFELKPDESQVVDVKLNLPLRVEPGKYFAYVEGYPDAKAKSGETKIGIAAASKLYFDVEPASIFDAIYFKIRSFWRVYAPWPQRAAVVLGIIVITLALKKHLNIQVSVKNNEKKIDE